MTYIVNADEIMKTMPGYEPNKSEVFHREAAKQADRAYEKAVKVRTEPLVILMAGGTASGKSEYVSVYLQSANAIIFDGTLPTFAGAEIKIKKAIKAKKQVAIHCVLPESFIIAFTAFLERERKFSSEHFYRTHSSTRKAVLEISALYPDINIKLIMSTVLDSDGEARMLFNELNFPDRNSLVEYLQREQYNKEEIKKQTSQL